MFPISMSECFQAMHPGNLIIVHSDENNSNKWLSLYGNRFSLGRVVKGIYKVYMAPQTLDHITVPAYNTDFV